MAEFRELFVAIAVHQWEPMVAFYRTVLDQSPHTLIPHSYAEFRAGGLKIGLFLPKDDHQSEFAQPTQSAISLCVEVDHLNHALERIDQAYAALEKTEYQAPGNHCRYGEMAIASHGRECYAYDPDGNRLILHEAISA